MRWVVLRCGEIKVIVCARLWVSYGVDEADWRVDLPCFAYLYHEGQEKSQHRSSVLRTSIAYLHQKNG